LIAAKRETPSAGQAGFTTGVPVGLADAVPFLLQTRQEQLGAEHTAAPNFQAHVVTDGRLVTGQNPASATGVAEAVLAELDG
jgi:putative intracellular protease/amidase